MTWAEPYWLTVWLLFGVYAAAIAEVHGRSWWRWVIVGVIFGPLATMAAWWLSRGSHAE